MSYWKSAAVAALAFTVCLASTAQDKDYDSFVNPPQDHRPQTWFHFIDGNVDKEGITKDLEAIRAAGISGIQLFHGGQSGVTWPGVKQHIECMSPYWYDAVGHTGAETERLGLEFTMQNCPGWSLAGGPWFSPEESMRALVMSRTVLEGGRHSDCLLPVAQEGNDGEWRDYRDVAVLAFPTPDGDEDCIPAPGRVTSDFGGAEVEGLFSGHGEKVRIKPACDGIPHTISLGYDSPVTVRSLVLSQDGGFNDSYTYELDTRITVKALMSDGREKTILDARMPECNWMDKSVDLTLALDEVTSDHFDIIIDNGRELGFTGMRLTSAARMNNWEAETARILRSNIYESDFTEQSASSFISSSGIVDVSGYMDTSGRLRWNVPEGNWTVLRIGHVNTGFKNAPAPPEATGWECDKLSKAGADKHFANYIGKLNDGPVKGTLDAMLIDSWECDSQTWTAEMENEFSAYNGYSVRPWLPALFGYVIDSHELTSCFLMDWRSCINHLFVNNFWGEMAELAAKNGLKFVYETAAGDIFPGDILEFNKFADVPMCEFWSHSELKHVGSINFKPIRPTASAARVYDKKRVSAESFTSFQLTWDEHFSRWKDLANQHFIQGVTHTVFHTYTHNPCADTMVPGTSFGSGIGSPFLRGQTWWKHMPEFTRYLTRVSYMLESGKAVTDVLWYLGDGCMHKPDQEAYFPEGFRYDYCTRDALLNRMSVRNGRICTKGGNSWSVIWLPDNHKMLPSTVRKLREMVECGAVIIGDRPLLCGTLVKSASVESAAGVGPESFKCDCDVLWGDGTAGIHYVGKGKVLSGMKLDEALAALGIKPDVLEAGEGFSGAGWLHRKDSSSDWYFIASGRDRSFSGTLDFNASGEVSIWEPVSGARKKAVCSRNGERTEVVINLPYAGSCFVVFERKGTENVSAKPAEKLESIGINEGWTLSFPAGWGAPAQIKLDSLAAWKDLPMSDEGKCFSGTATYTDSFRLKSIRRGNSYVLNLGCVDEVAVVYVNGIRAGTLWCEPYSVDVSEFLHKGTNDLRIEVTSTWFNRLVYDAGQKESEKKTWVLNGPDYDSPLRTSGLIGPVSIDIFR